MPKGTYKYGNLARLGAFGVGAWFLWRLATGDRSFTIQQGKNYRFTLIAHSYGDFAEWWAEANEALIESDATNIAYARRGEGDAIVSFEKVAPVTTKLAPHAILYPSSPPLATATLLEAPTLRPNSSVTPLGTSTS